MNKHFLTFGDSRGYRASLDRIGREVAAMDYFASARICNESDIAELVAEHADFFARSRTGFGYWIWKSYLVGKCLEAMAEDDILLYSDAGCQFNANAASLRRLDEYFDMLADSPHSTLSFELIHKERAWTKRDCFDQLGAPVDDREQLVGGVFLIKKSRPALELIDGINRLVADRHYHLFDDSPSVAPNDPDFVEHRHDQSVFSLKRKLAGTLVLPDETWFEDGDGIEDWDSGRNFPIHARRLRS